MIDIELNDFTAEDVQLIQQLKDLGFADTYIQELYDREQARRKDENNDRS